MNRSDPSDATLLEERRDGVAILTLNRPDRRNALSNSLIAGLAAALERHARDRRTRAIILGGAGPDFCAGHDLEEMTALRAGRDGGREAFAELFRRCSDLMVGIARHPKPVIARVHGAACAAGCQLVATCDLAVASEDARFATPGVRIGLFCSTPMVALGRTLSRKRTMEMLLTGDSVDARQALDHGLVNRVVAREALSDATFDLAEHVAARSGEAIRHGKRIFADQMEMPLEAAYRLASGVMAENMLEADAEEGIDAFLEKRPPDWPGRRNTA